MKKFLLTLLTLVTLLLPITSSVTYATEIQIKANSDDENLWEKVFDEQFDINNDTAIFSNAIEQITSCYNIKDVNPTIQQTIDLYYQFELDKLCNEFRALGYGIVNKEKITPLDTFIYNLLYSELTYSNKTFTDKSRHSFRISTITKNLFFMSEEYGTKNITDATSLALEDTWEWVYDYYIHTNEFYNFYANDNIPYVAELKERLGIKLNPSDDTTITTTEPQTTTSNQEATTSSNSSITNNESTTANNNDNLDKNDSNLIIVFVIIISILICTIVILLAILFFKNKNKKNNSSTNNINTI